VLIAGPNLTIDRTSTLPALRPGEVLRVADVEVTPGGKGLNVARAARALGARAMLVGFLPGRTGRAAGELIADEGVSLAGVTVAGEIRSTAIILEDGGRATVINEPGPEIDDDDWMAFEAAVGADLDRHRVLVCSGSVPPGSPEDAYARLVVRAHREGVPVIVDATGPILKAALEVLPDLVTPNLGEAESLLHGRADEAVDAAPDAQPRAEAAALELVRAGAAAAIVTAAAAGAALAVGDDVTWLPAPRIERVANPIGAGDALTAAVAAALEDGLDLIEAARRGVAAGAASVEAPRAGELDPLRVTELL
jgi:1-phosphofructokinase family hexose kinase